MQSAAAQTRPNQPTQDRTPASSAPARMDRQFIAENQIVERYLTGRLPPKGMMDFEQYCRRHPELWSRSATPAPASEQARLDYNRTHGWSAIPSDTHTETTTGLEGRGTGHGIGLCQLGAVDLAHHGESYAQILALYYPNSALSTLP